ncbi:hypothetical protein BH11CYA1_BH11CYA1_24720 [soil metagenome]
MVANRPSESIEVKSDRLASMLDSGQGKQVVNQLRHEFESMSPREYSRLVREISRKDDKSLGVNLLVVMQGKAELVLVDDGKGRPNHAPKSAEVPSQSSGPARSLADMRQKAIEKDPCARYQDLRLNQLDNISRQYAANAPRPEHGQLPGRSELPVRTPVVIDVAAQQRLQAVAAECKLSLKKQH